MRFSFLIFPILISSGFASYVEDYESANSTCYEELDLTYDDWKVVGEKRLCLQQCLLEKNGVVDKTGSFYEEKIPSHIKNFFKKCFNSVKTDDPCKKIHLILDCTASVTQTDGIDLVKTCGVENKVDGNDFGDDALETLNAESRACFNKCVLVKLGVYNEHDELIWDEYYKLFDYIGIDLEIIVQECEKENQQEDSCLRISKRSYCIIKKVLDSPFKEISEKVVSFLTQYNVY